MPFSYKDYTGDGSTTTFSITFDYQKESEISVTVDGVAQSGFTFPSSTQVQLTTAPAASTLVRIRRTTDLDSREVDFASGSVLTEEDLDNSNIQVFHAAQEAIDTSNDAISLDDDDKWNAQSKVIKNVANPVNAQDAATKDYLENTWLTASDKAQLNALDTDNLDTVADDVANVNTVATNIADVNTVAARDADIDTVAARDTDIGTVASRDADIGTVADRDADIGTVADRDTDIGTVAARDADIGTVADDLDLASPKITTVANNITNVNTVAGISSDVTTVAGISTDVSAVEDIASNVTTVAGIDSDVSTVSSISADVTTVADNDANVTTVAGNDANITTVAGISGNVTTVAGISADTTTVAGISANVTTVAGNNANVSTVAGISSDVTTVAGVAADVTTAATNIADITAVADEVNKVISVANDLAEATSEIDVVAGSIANVDAVGADIANVNTVATNISDVNSFADTYFISATAPASPTIGDLWFDTTNDVMKVYASGGFVNAGSAVNGTSNRETYTVGTSEGSYTGSTTVFPIEYDAGYIDVFLNGIKLDPDNDFTATNGTSVTLSSAAATGDVVDMVGYGTFELSNFSVGDANDVDLTGLADDQFLQYDSATSKFKPATIATDVSGDSTPQLGGDLDTNGNDINFGDNDKAQFGAGDDLQIYHDGSNSYIDDIGTGDLILRASDQFRVRQYANNEDMIEANTNGSVRLFYDNSPKIATTSTGVDVTGRITTDQITELASGNIGFGKTSPAYKGHFADASGATRVQVENTNNAAGGAGVYLTTYNSGTLVGNATLACDNSGNFKIFTGTNTGTERLRIKADGSWGKAPAGTIIQTKTVTDSTRRKFTSKAANTFHEDYTALNMSFTPKSNNSTLMVFVNLKYGVDANSAYSMFWQIREGTTVHTALNGATSGSYRCFDSARADSYNSNVQYNLFTASIIGGVLNNSSTSARSFNFRYRFQGGSRDMSINRDGSDSSDSSHGSHSPTSVSTFTIVEIAK